MKMKLWKPIVLTLAVFALPVIGIAGLLALALCKAAGRTSRELERMERHADFPKGDNYGK
jgi:hypothetical protein